MSRRRLLLFLASAITIFGGMYVVSSAIATLRTLDLVEAERDTWQRPAEVLKALDLKEGNTVADVGAGAGYFSLKISPFIGSRGRLLAVDLRRLSLTFLWIRTFARSPHNVHLILGEEDDPHLPPGGVDAVLIANTYHEFRNHRAMIAHVFTALRAGGRVVAVDRGPGLVADGHEVTMQAVAQELQQGGFEILYREDPFIHPPGDDPWWLLVSRKP
jgi:predicted methyltransferase